MPLTLQLAQACHLTGLSRGPLNIYKVTAHGIGSKSMPCPPVPGRSRTSCAFSKQQISPDLPPPEMVGRLVAAISGMQTTQVLGALCRLGVPDLVDPSGDVYLPVGDMAAKVGANAGVLYRVLRAAASMGVFKESPEGGAFAATPATLLLRTDHPASLSAMASLFSMPGHYATMGQLLHTLKTGECGTQRLMGTDFFTYLTTQAPEEFAVFDKAMVGLTAATTAPVVAGHDWGRYAKVVDVGGGFGTLLEGLLRGNPGLQGQVFEQPQVVDAAPPVPQDLAGRMSYVKGTFFEPISVRSDCFAMKHILHDWSDEESVAILGNLAGALEPGGAVVLLESVVPDPGQGGGDGSCWKDMIMLSVTTGKERTRAEWQQVAAAAGYTIASIQPLPGCDLSAIVLTLA